MYYSKNSSVSIPRNYGGNAFKVIDESDRTYRQEKPDPLPFDSPSADEVKEKASCDNENKEAKKEVPLFSSLLSGISVEDVLLLGLIFVIHEGNPNDPVLFLLLILLLSK